MRSVAINIVVMVCLFTLSRTGHARKDDPPAPLSLLPAASAPAPAEEPWCAVPLSALDGPLATDRPGFSDTYALVPRGRYHIEGGYTFTYDREKDTRTTNHLLGEGSLRVGITDDFELRVKWAGLSLTEFHMPGTSRWAGRNIMVTDHDDGGTDLSVGFKAPLLQGDSPLKLSIIPALSIPTGSSDKTTGDVDPEIRVAWNHALTERWVVYGVGVIVAISDAQGRFAQSGASLATSYQFTPTISGFAEYFGVYPSARDVDCQHNVNFGPVFLISDNAQIDVRIGFGLNSEAPDFFTGIGLAVRF